MSPSTFPTCSLNMISYSWIHLSCYVFFNNMNNRWEQIEKKTKGIGVKAS